MRSQCRPSTQNQPRTPPRHLPALRLPRRYPKRSQRQVTTTPLQQLFVLNSEWFEYQAKSLAQRVHHICDSREKIQALYRRTLQRNRTPRELDQAQAYRDTRDTHIIEYTQAPPSHQRVYLSPLSNGAAGVNPAARAERRGKNRTTSIRASLVAQSRRYPAQRLIARVSPVRLEREIPGQHHRVKTQTVSRLQTQRRRRPSSGVT